MQPTQYVRAIASSRLGVAMIMVSACACSPGIDSATTADTTQVEHAERTDQLGSLMRELAKLRDERLSEALDAERSHKIDAIAETARQIASSAEQIEFARPEDAPVGLNPSEFQMRAELLRRLALKLAERAPTSPDAKLRELVDAIDATCAGCHNRFRP
jgi:cytochrome c556